MPDHVRKGGLARNRLHRHWWSRCSCQLMRTANIASSFYRSLQVSSYSLLRRWGGWSAAGAVQNSVLWRGWYHADCSLNVGLLRVGKLTGTSVKINRCAEAEGDASCGPQAATKRTVLGVKKRQIAGPWSKTKITAKGVWQDRPKNTPCNSHKLWTTYGLRFVTKITNRTFFRKHIKRHVFCSLLPGRKNYKIIV